MAVWRLPTTSPHPLLPSFSQACLGATRTGSDIRPVSVSVSGIAYPAPLVYSNTRFVVKSANYNVQIMVEEDEPEERLVNRFRKEVLRAGVLQECRRRRFFETPQDKIKRKAREASRRNRKRRPQWRTPAQNIHESPNNEKDDEEDDDDNWELPDVDVPYS